MKKDGTPWTTEDINMLKKLASENIDTDEIARRLERSKEAVYKKASELGISVKPKDKPNVN